MLIVDNLENFFSEKINSLEKYQEPTRAYVVNVFKNAKKETTDYSKESITILYNQAKIKHQFDLYQNLGDWILFINSLFPESLNNASNEYYTVVAQNSYYKCYRILQGKWTLFEELADKFPSLIESLQATLRPTRIISEEDSLFCNSNFDSRFFG